MSDRPGLLPIFLLWARACRQTCRHRRRRNGRHQYLAGERDRLCSSTDLSGFDSRSYRDCSGRRSRDTAVINFIETLFAAACLSLALLLEL